MKIRQLEWKWIDSHTDRIMISSVSTRIGYFYFKIYKDEQARYKLMYMYPKNTEQTVIPVCSFEQGQTMAQTVFENYCNDVINELIDEEGLNEPVNMLFNNEWSLFEQTGLINWINNIIKTFGWSLITFKHNDDILSVYPARVQLNQYDKKRNLIVQNYDKVRKHLAQTIEELSTEMDPIEREDN